MEGLILGINTLYRLFCFFKLFPMVSKGLIAGRNNIGISILAGLGRVRGVREVASAIPSFHSMFSSPLIVVDLVPKARCVGDCQFQPHTLLLHHWTGKEGGQGIRADAKPLKLSANQAHIIVITKLIYMPMSTYSRVLLIHTNTPAQFKHTLLATTSESRCVLATCNHSRRSCMCTYRD